jgi:Family of unknown function (DUF5677)
MTTTRPTPMHGHQLHESFLQALAAEIGPGIVTKKLGAKAAAQGLLLSKSQREVLRRRIAAGNLSDFRLPGRRGPRQKNVRLRWTARDTRDFERVARRAMKQVPRIISAESETLAENIMASLKARWKSQHAREDLTLAAFRMRLAKRWRLPLERLAMMLTITREFSEMVGARLQQEQSSSNKNLVAVLVRLHARACQVGAEVLTLLREGFPDGAMARWRTLHEIAVVAMFIRDRGDAMAERYLFHSTMESHKAMLSYQAHARRLRLRRLPARQVQAITRDFNALLSRFGRPFKSDYGWASETPTEQPNFSEIEAKISVEHWRPYYRLASYSVHANPKGILFKMGMPHSSDLLLMGPSNYGFADPGQSTPLSLNQVSAAWGTVSPTLDTIVILKILDRLANEVSEAFVNTQLKLPK